MAETNFQCPYCGRLGSTSREIPPGAVARCSGCRQTFPIESSHPSATTSEPDQIGLEPGAFSEVKPRRFSIPGDSPTAPSLELDPVTTTPAPARWARMIIAISIGATVMVLSLLIGGTWLVIRGIGQPRSPVPLPILTTDEVAARAEASIGFVSGPTGSGTGFMVADGLLATNAHVIDSIPPDQIQVTFPAAPELDRGPMLGRVVYFDPDRDLAILKISTRLKPLPMALNHTFRRGQDVVVIGNPGVGNGRALECVVSRGVLGSKVDLDGQSFYQLSGTVNPGNSGGPALDLSGKVVGVVESKAIKQEGLAFCIPVADLVDTVQEVKGNPDSLAKIASQRHVEAVQAAAGLARLRAAMERTRPGTWVAMIDANHELNDDDPAAQSSCLDMDLADKLYADSQVGMFWQIISTVNRLKNTGCSVTATEVLTASVTWAPRQYFQGKGVKFSVFADQYITERRRGIPHEPTLIALQERSGARTVPSRRPSSPRPSATEMAPVQPAYTPTRPAVVSSSIPPALTKSYAASPPALPGMLQSARTFEQQKKLKPALRLYRDIVDDNPGTFEADEASQRLAVLTRPLISSDQLPAKVLDVPDCQTVVVDLGGARIMVRLIGLDPIPKIQPPGTQPMRSERAAAYLRDLLSGHSVYLDYERGISQSDGQGHTLAYLYRMADLLDVNREVLARGFGIASKIGTFSRADDFRDAEAHAKSRKVGIWKQ